MCISHFQHVYVPLLWILWFNALPLNNCCTALRGYLDWCSQCKAVCIILLVFRRQWLQTEQLYIYIFPGNILNQSTEAALQNLPRHAFPDHLHILTFVVHYMTYKSSSLLISSGMCLLVLHDDIQSTEAAAVTVSQLGVRSAKFKKQQKTTAFWDILLCSLLEVDLPWSADCCPSSWSVF